MYNPKGQRFRAALYLEFSEKGRESMPYTIRTMTREYAAEISQWAYENEYSVYSFKQDATAIDELLNGDYIACTDQDGRVIGYFCKNESARIPTGDGYNYSNDKLDIGLGMLPALCGKGMGYEFLLCGIEYMTSQTPYVPLRLTVASFNERAISLYKRAGFTVERTVKHKISGAPFYIMSR